MIKLFQELSKQKILTIAYLEGATVMAVELLSTKMIAPFFGTSLYTWSAVLAITLSALTGGYFLGAKLSNDSNFLKTLFYILSSIFIWILIMPFIGHLLMSNLINSNYKFATIISSLILISPAMILLGSISPQIINILGVKESAGKASGIIYAVSTLGGVMNTMALGLFLIPKFGIRICCFITSLLMLISMAIIFFSPKKTRE